jgi:dicarboxylate/amino acid:cation (Na+ or H+) symporter, DAACS family
MNSPPTGRRVALHWKILVGLVVGTSLGLAANLWGHDAAGAMAPGLRAVVDYVARPIGEVFIRLVMMVVVPLVFAALVLGIAGVGDVRKLGRLGLQTLALTVLLSGVSVGIGLTLVNTLRPGAGIDESGRLALREKYAGESVRAVENAAKSKNLRDTLLDIVPRNPLQEMVGATDGSSPGGGMLAVMFFALLFGIAVSLSPERCGPLVAALEGVYDALMRIIGWAMQLAPLAVTALMFRLTAELGLDVFRMLGGYVGIVVAGLALHMFVTYPLVLRLVGGRSPAAFFRGASEAMMTALATASSNATLPTSLRVAGEKLGIPRGVANFVLTVGATANQNGTALFEGVTVLFLAQVFNIELTLAQQVQVALMCVLAGIGTAGVPGGSLPLVVIVLKTVGIPAEAIAIVLGVDRLLDMCRTCVNVTGDLTIAACVGGGELQKNAER